MITLLCGENSFEIDREVARIMSEFDGTPEKIDGTDLEKGAFIDLLAGGTLFAEKRLVVIKDLSSNKTIWQDSDSWLERISSDIDLVLVEHKPDKRTKTYKALQKTATVKEFPVWGERDSRVAERWARDEATRLGFTIDEKSVRKLVERTGIDQWRVFHALEKLAVLDTVTPEVIEDLIESNPIENVFLLFETALGGDTIRLGQILHTLEETEDPYKVFGLLAGQGFQLMALSVADKPAKDVASEIGAHPFVLSKLAPQAKRLGREGCRQVITILADTDAAMKSSGVEPWILIGQALHKIAQKTTS